MAGSSEVEHAATPQITQVGCGFWSDYRVRAQATRGPGEPLMEVEGLAGEQLADVSFTLHVGEILGLAGLKEAGIGELPLILGGARPRRAGRISVAGHEFAASGGPGASVAAGIVLLPGDRAHDGGV